mgnify:CR=1 FL=1
MWSFRVCLAILWSPYVVDELCELECFGDFGADFGEFEEVYESEGFFEFGF